MSPSQILNTISHSKHSLSLPELLSKHPSVPRRTLQRWLKQLVDEKKIRPEGKARARRYRVTQIAPPVYYPLASDEQSSRLILASPKPLYETNGGDTFPSIIPLSPDSLEVLAQINQPLSSRKKVQYQPDFLNGYQPNHSSYLSPSICRQLEKLGNVGKDGLPAGTYGREILNRLRIDLSWASSNLEGNTYSLLETRKLIEQGKLATGKDITEARMILNHKTAIEFLVENADSVRFNRYTILNLQGILSENLLPNRLDEGRIREHMVYIGKSTYSPPTIPSQISMYLDMLLEKADQITNPFEQSFFVMVHLPYLQPFADVNKRTSRLAANMPLIRANLCPLTFLGVPVSAYSRAILAVYELNRVELLRDLYLWAYEQSAGEYITTKREMVGPDPAGFAYRDVIKQAVHDAVTNPHKNTLTLVQKCVEQYVPRADRENIYALIMEELRRLHEGVLVRYGIGHAQFLAWKEKQKR